MHIMYLKRMCINFLCTLITNFDSYNLLLLTTILLGIQWVFSFLRVEKSIVKLHTGHSVTSKRIVFVPLNKTEA